MQSHPPTRTPTMRWHLVGMTCLVVTLTCPLGTLAAQDPLPTQNALAGSRVFGSAGCSLCHAINGLGGTHGPDLARFPQSRTFYDLATAMWNHLPGMVSQMEELGIERPHLSGREIGDLIALLFSVGYFDAPGDVDRGQAIFAQKRCVSCHQVAGTGGVIGPNLGTADITPIEFAAGMWNHGPAMSEAMRSQGIQRPRFSGAELNDLIAYLKSTTQSLPTGPLYVVPGLAGEGRRTFVEKHCNDCHAVSGQGGSGAPDLAERARSSSLLTFAAAMWNKAPAMLASMQARGLSVPSLTPREMANLVSYMYSVKYFAQAGDARRGRQRVRDRGCLACHALDGRGEKAARDFAVMVGLDSPAAVIAALWNHVLIREAPASGQPAWPRMGSRDVADLTAFLQSISTARSPSGR